MNRLKISEILINARISQGISLSVASEETKISIQHLEALERDDYDVFPNYTLALGFLRSYIDFLDLDDKQISLLFQKSVNEGLEYKRNPLGKIVGSRVQSNYENNMSTKIRSSRGSILDSLLMSPYWIFVSLLGFIASISLVGWLGILAYSLVIQTTLVSKERIIQWDGINIWEGSVRKGDRLVLKNEKETFSAFIVSEISSNFLSIKIDEEEYRVEKEERCLISFKGAAREDMILSFDGEQVVLRPILEGELLITVNTLGDRNSLFPGIPFEFQPLSSEALQGPVYATAFVKPDMSSISLVLRDSSFIRYLADEGSIEEVFLQEGSVLDISFANSLLLWVANPKAVIVTMGREDLNLWGDSVLGIGQLIWVQNSKGNFELRFLPL